MYASIHIKLQTDLSVLCVSIRGWRSSKILVSLQDKTLWHENLPYETEI